MISDKLLKEGFFRYVSNPLPNRCPVMRCTNHPRHGEALCSRHYMQRWRSKNPRQAQYAKLKSKAKQRGIHFDLTFEEFLDVVSSYPFDSHTGEYKDKLSIDRIDADKGYVSGNLQVITVSENSIKARRLDYSPEGRYWAARAEEAESEDSVPF